jgi:diaminobutyrate-2-oxoglutarate transaminase
MNVVAHTNTVFDRLESSVCCYARNFPVTFDAAEGVHLIDRDGHRYLDFLAGAGTLNYGHNHPALKRALIDYIARDGVAHSLDLHTAAKEAFLAALERIVLEPRALDYRVQFTGPTGTNAVEAAIKIARNAIGRTNIVAFTNGFHGVSLGAVALTGNGLHREAAGVPLGGVTRAAYDNYFGPTVDSITLLERLLEDRSSGVDLPAAAIVETVQGEGGLNVASSDWLQRLEALCRRHGMLLIVDDIQAGCGRTGTFFSFESAGIEPDIVTLSKSLSGYGLPLAIVLLKPELDLWKPGAHNGTFRGNNHAFVTARVALEHFWSDDSFEHDIARKSELMRDGLAELASAHSSCRVKGRGMMLGLDLGSGEQASAVAAKAFEEGLLIETSGPDGEVVKSLCPLVAEDADIVRGLDILGAAMEQVLGTRDTRHPQIRETTPCS